MATFAFLLLLVGCGDTLVDARYRGEALFTLQGSIEPDQYVNGADLICSAEGDSCYDACYAEFYTEEREDDLCLARCTAEFQACQKKNAGETFTSAYYDSAETQRVAVIWADPSQTMSESISTQPIIQQRSAISTGFPARYTVSLYQPPPPEAMFKAGKTSYAYGIIVTFYDRDQDESFDIETEPIIGFNPGSGVLYTPTSFEKNDGEGRVGPGYHLFMGQTSCESGFLDLGFGSPSSETKTMIISGTTPSLFDQIPDVGCDGHQREWLGLCQAPIYRATCNAMSPPPSYEALCDFCTGRWPSVNLSLRRENQADDPGDDPIFDDCNYDEPADAALCLAEQEYNRCLSQAQSAEDNVQCERAREIADCETLALTDDDRSQCASIVDAEISDDPNEEMMTEPPDESED